MASIWGGDSPSVAWGRNSWASNTVTISLTAPTNLTSSVGAIAPTEMQVGLTGISATSSVGSIVAAQIITVSLTAPSTMTSSVGSISLVSVQLTAPSQMTSQLGDFDNAGTLVGWGRNGWGEEPWGDSFNKLIQPEGISATASVGSIVPEIVVPLTAPTNSTSSVGSLTIAIENFIPLTAPSAATASVGSIVPAIGVPLTAPTNLTSSVGAITPADAVGITGLSATASVGSIEVTQTQLVILTAPSALSTSVGSVNIELVVPLTAPTNLTASVGAINPADVIGITGVEATVSVGGVSPLGYQDVDITGYTSYTDVNLVA
tara:strand:+ start:1535 stop:2491 length:957 start_codon:yes stop_codon:yes gene_type:complete